VCGQFFIFLFIKFYLSSRFSQNILNFNVIYLINFKVMFNEEGLNIK